MREFIIAVIGILAGGGLSWIFKIRPDRAGATSDAITKSGEAMEKLLDNVKQQQDVFNSIIEQKDKTIEQQASLLEDYKISLDEATQKIKAFEYKTKENERKIIGMQKILDGEIGKKLFAENNICLVDDCDLRQPEKGKFKGHS